ncbi:MAG: DUF1244 domain-containing protein [Proteobacteria bacterium]|nr:DUF1244 domain-containing protein [Pseudomonadota bacterium]
MTKPKPNQQTTQAIEAAVFRRLVAHLQKRVDVQNIDMMILAGFCRNCLGDWYAEAARDAGVACDKNQGRQHVYGMSYAEWKTQYQTEATPEKLALLKAQTEKHAHTSSSSQPQPPKANPK